MNRINYEIICAAVNGDPEALNEIVRHYGGYLNILSREASSNGSDKFYVDNTLKDEITIKLIEAITKFKI